MSVELHGKVRIIYTLGLSEIKESKVANDRHNKNPRIPNDAARNLVEGSTVPGLCCALPGLQALI